MKTTSFRMAVIVSLVFLAGCQGMSSNPATVMLKAKLADTLLQSGQVEDVVISPALSEQELQVVIDALGEYQSFRDKWGDTDAGSVVTNLVTVTVDYGELYAAYKSVESVVVSHWDEYSPAQQATLQSYQRQAQDLHSAFTELIEARENQQAIDTALQFGLIAAQLAAT